MLVDAERASHSGSGSGHSPLTWLGSDRRLARRVARPVFRLSRLEVFRGLALLAAAIIALAWVNSPWESSYHLFLETSISLNVGGLSILDTTLEKWIHDGLMTLFFFVVGLEIKQEVVTGELRKPSFAALPVVAALGGMAVPALIYVAFNAGGAGASGWAIPMATDIAFAVGVLSLLGDRVQTSLKIFLLSLAIVDDIGAIAVIAIFYADDLSANWLLASAALIALLALLRSARVWYMPVYAVVGSALWFTCLESGVHATVVGVILALFTPAIPLVNTGRTGDLAAIGELVDGKHGKQSVQLMRRVSFEVRERLSVTHRLHEMLSPWVSFFVMPAFALASAGVSLNAASAEAARSSSVTFGIIFGLVLGKLVGIPLFSWLGVRSGLCKLPQGITWGEILGVSALSGIGFTVSLFIAKMEFGSSSLMPEAKIGILLASVLAAAIGLVILVFSYRNSGRPAGRDAAS